MIKSERFYPQSTVSERREDRRLLQEVRANRGRVYKEKVPLTKTLSISIIKGQAHAYIASPYIESSDYETHPFMESSAMASLILANRNLMFIKSTDIETNPDNYSISKNINWNKKLGIIRNLSAPLKSTDNHLSEDYEMFKKQILEIIANNIELLDFDKEVKNDKGEFVTQPANKKSLFKYLPEELQEHCKKTFFSLLREYHCIRTDKKYLKSLFDSIKTLRTNETTKNT